MLPHRQIFIAFLLLVFGSGRAVELLAYLCSVLLAAGGIYLLYRFQLDGRLAAAKTRHWPALDTVTSRLPLRMEGVPAAQVTGHRPSAFTGSVAAPEENAFVLKVRGIVETHLTDPALDVERLCREVGMSNSQLHRKLTTLTGHSANRFVRSIRLSKACALLRDPELTIAAVAYECGFNDPVYFARVFRQTFNMSPSAWRHAKIG